MAIAQKKQSNAPFFWVGPDDLDEEVTFGGKQANKVTVQSSGLTSVVWPKPVTIRLEIGIHCCREAEVSPYILEKPYIIRSPPLISMVAPVI